MFAVIGLMIIIIIIGLYQYKQYELNIKDEKMKWIDSVPYLPILGNALDFHGTNESLYDMVRLHSKYGKTLLLRGPTGRIVVSVDYDFVEFLLSTTSVLNKSDEYTFLHQWLGSGLLTSDGPKWKQMRKILTPSFHFSILQQFIASFEANGVRLVEKLKKMQGKDINIYRYITLYALDVICESSMGVSINAQEIEDSEYVKNVKLLCKIVAERQNRLRERFDLVYWLFPNYYREKRAVRQIHNFTYAVIDSRRKLLEESSSQEETDRETKKRVAFLDMLLQSTIDGRPLTNEEIRAEVDTFMFEVQYVRSFYKEMARVWPPQIEWRFRV